VTDTATSASVQVRPYVDADEPEVLDLLRNSMGEGPAGARTSQFFRWKHTDSPFGRSFMLVAVVAGRIVGLRAFMRWNFEVNGQTVTGVRAVDTATHPDYRRMGIFSRLTSEAVEALHEQADLIFNTPNEKSLPGYLKLGWEVVGRVPVRIKPLRPAKLAAGLMSLRTGAGAGSPRPDVAAEPASELLGSGSDVDWLLERAEHEDSRLRTVRSIAFLRWRYGDTPFDYRAVVVRGREGLEGLAILRVRRRGRLWETTIAELVTDSHSEGVQRALLTAAARACSSDHVSLATPPDATAPIARAGFLPSPASVTLVARRLSKTLPVDVTARSSWALSLGDIEVF
jgi:GNAT superfamily N-acetyltransferase